MKALVWNMGPLERGRAGLGHWILGFLLKIFPGKRSGPGQVLAGWAQALRMCESEPHPRPRDCLTHSSFQLWEVRLGIMPLSEPLKVKDSFINKFSHPSKLSPQNKYFPPFEDWGGSVLGPAPLEGQPPSVRNRSLTPQAKTPMLEFQHI